MQDATKFNIKVVVGRVLLLLSILFIWQVISPLLGGDLWLSTPFAIGQRLWDLTSSGDIFIHLYTTLLESALGIIVGVSLGVSLPMILRYLPRAAEVIDPFIVGIYAIPKIAYAPLVILWLGIDLGSKVAISGMIVFFLVFFNAYAGVRDVPPRLIDLARVMGGSEWKIAYHIVLKNAFPYIFAGLKIALPYSVGGAIVGEFIASSKGLGFLIIEASETFDTPGVFAGIIVVSMIIVVINTVIKAVEKRIMSWRPPDTTLSSVGI